MSIPELKAKTVYECWLIARDATERYQELANNTESEVLHSFWINKRDAADEIALKIRNGEEHEK